MKDGSTTVRYLNNKSHREIEKDKFLILNINKKIDVFDFTEKLQMATSSLKEAMHKITLDYTEEAQIPEDAELKVTEITDTDARFEDYLQKTVGRVEKPDAARVSDDDDADEESMQDAIPEGAAAAWSAKPVYAADDPAYVRFFDIEIQSGGQKVEPKAEVFVQICPSQAHRLHLGHVL